MHSSKMKSFSLAATAALSILSFSTIAYSADIPSRLPSAPIFTTSPAYSWAGPYVGLQLGGSFGAAPFRTTGFVNTSRTDRSNAIAAGAFAGYRFNLAPNWLLGVEGQANIGNHDYRSAGVTDAKTAFDARLLAAVGYSFGDRNQWLAEGVGGVAFVRETYLPNAANTWSRTATSPVAGVRLNYALNSMLRVRASVEHRFASNANHSFFPGFNTRLGTSDTRAMVGIFAQF